MARLNNQVDSDDDLPELFTILESRAQKQQFGQKPSSGEKIENLTAGNALPEMHVIKPDHPLSRKQRSLGRREQAPVNSLLFPMPRAQVHKFKDEGSQSREAIYSPPCRARRRGLENNPAGVVADISDMNHRDSYSYTGLSDFIVPDSASDEEALATRSSKKEKKKKYEEKSPSLKKILPANRPEPEMQASDQPPTNTQKDSGKGFPEKGNRERIIAESPPSNEQFGPEQVEAHPKPDGYFIS